MNNEELNDFSNNPKYIQGIYNYCDSWCERCSFSARCLNYELSEKQFLNPESRDIKNREFWEKIEEVLLITIALIQEQADEFDIDLNHPESNGNDLVMDIKLNEIERFEIIRDAKNYIRLAEHWLKSEEKSLSERRQILNNIDAMNLQQPKSLEQTFKITDASEIIQWYIVQILVKLERALYSRFDETIDLDDDFQKDSDGSAKVALIGIDRSIAAWGRLYNYFDESEDKILNILLHLTKLRDNIELEFPNARSFVRIGFDD
jgi:hypothetical protein